MKKSFMLWCILLSVMLPLTAEKKTSQAAVTVSNTPASLTYTPLQNTGLNNLKIQETILFVIFVAAIAVIISGYISAAHAKKETQYLIQKQANNSLLIKQIIDAFANTIDCKDSYTKGHSFRVAWYTSILAEKMGCSQKQIEKYYDIALLHDIGKMGIPDKILTKEGKLTDSEYSIIKSHSSKGYEILSKVSMFPDLANGVKYHHERVDGKGYPDGLKGEDIPLIARIIAVADTFDAMASTRAYRKRLPLNIIVQELQNAAGNQLDTKIVAFMIQIVKDGNLADTDPFEEYYK